MKFRRTVVPLSNTTLQQKMPHFGKGREKCNKRHPLINVASSDTQMQRQLENSL